MRRRPVINRRLVLGVVPVALAMIAAGCGGGSPSGTTGPASGAARPAPNATAATADPREHRAGFASPPAAARAQGDAYRVSAEGAT
jgi:hypothetical protein